METRHQILLLKPGNRNHWINFAVAHHLDKNYDLAVQVRSLPQVLGSQCSPCLPGSCVTASSESVCCTTALVSWHVGTLSGTLARAAHNYECD